MTRHTGGTWRQSPNASDAIISDEPVRSIAEDQDVLDHYGGHVICESVAPKNRPIIIAAPDLLRELMKAVEWVRLFDAYGPGLNGFECEWLRSAHEAIARADAEVPL